MIQALQNFLPGIYLPAVLVGIAASLLCCIYVYARVRHTKKKNPDLIKQLEIEEKDERNIAIANKAKAKAFNYMILVYSALLPFFMARQADVLIWGSMVAANISSLLVFTFLMDKYHKEM
ncbi:MAG: hypothetical protein FWB96_04180 [Defluviitaleaceae bacterium]|nr:hypothetical protein [Defluviitaleaceae bacterium]MCL2263134.1 hypothetical protein [Defluviitaleaceae bacterium]